MALCLRELGIKSVPVNMLNPIPGTPLENNPKLTQDDMRRIVAVYRFILPDAAIRLAGGRGLLPDQGKSCFVSGANAAISGDMLTTADHLSNGYGAFEGTAIRGGDFVSKNLFITGTGTDVGKTYVTGMILKKLCKTGRIPLIIKRL